MKGGVWFWPCVPLCCSFYFWNAVPACRQIPDSSRLVARGISHPAEGLASPHPRLCWGLSSPLRRRLGLVGRRLPSSRSWYAPHFARASICAHTVTDECNLHIGLANGTHITKWDASQPFQGRQNILTEHLWYRLWMWTSTLGSGMQNYRHPLICVWGKIVDEWWNVVNGCLDMPRNRLQMPTWSIGHVAKLKTMLAAWRVSREYYEFTTRECLS